MNGNTSLLRSSLKRNAIPTNAEAVYLVALIVYVLPAKNVIEKKRREAMEPAYGYPELSLINIKYSRPGAAYAKAEESSPGADNNEMESL